MSVRSRRAGSNAGGSTPRPIRSLRSARHPASTAAAATPLCDPAKLVTYLGANPDKAKAWASVLGIDPAGIAAYVGTLTPVVLTTDTLVTNHGYANGHATSLQSVLQAGTAVMVDATGTPRVKCNCGNPLAPPEPITVTKTQGTPWPGYSPTAVTVIKPGPPTKTLTLINTKTGDDYPQAVGAGKGATKTPIKSTRGEFVAALPNSVSFQTSIFTSRDAVASGPPPVGSRADP